MNTLISIFYFLCSLFSMKDAPAYNIWKLTESGTTINKEERHLIDSRNSVLIPFLWKEIAYSSLDTMIKKRCYHDSVDQDYVSRGVEDYLPEPVKLFNNNFIVVCDGMKTIKLDTCSYTAWIFSTNLGDDFAQDDYCQFYYVESFGIIAAVHKQTGKYSPEWPTYELVDVENQRGTSVVNKQALDSLLDKIVTWY